MRLTTRFVKYGLASAVALACLAGGASAQTLCAADIDGSTPLNNPAGCDRVWGDDVNECPIIIRGPVFVLDTVLTIEDGCVVRGEPRTEDYDAGDPLLGFPGTLIISRDGFLDARGNPGAPIVFTTAAVDNNDDGIPDDDDSNGNPDAWSPGDKFLDDTPLTNPMAPLLTNGEQNYGLHGGLVLVGRAPTNLDDSKTGIQGQGTCEGLPVPGVEPAAATYGGNEPHDSSGVIEYMSIRHAGDEIKPADELNGWTLCGVGDGTIINNAESYANGDDGFEMFGGTVALRNVVVAYAGDDSIDVDQGYTGTIHSALTLSTFFNEDDGGSVGTGGSGDAAGEFDGEDCPACFVDDDGFSFPNTNMIATNWTHVGNQPDAGVTNPAVSAASANQGIEADTDWNGVIANVLILNQGSRDCIEMLPSAGDRGNRFITSTTCADSTGFNDDGSSTDAESAGAAGDAQVAAGNEYVGGSANDDAFTGQVLANENHYFLPKGVTSSGRGKLAGSKTNSAGAAGGPAFDPRPLNPANAEVSGGIEPQWPGMDRSATYKGAFGDSATLWTTPWSVLTIGGVLAN